MTGSAANFEQPTTREQLLIERAQELVASVTSRQITPPSAEGPITQNAKDVIAAAFDDHEVPNLSAATPLQVAVFAVGMVNAVQRGRPVSRELAKRRQSNLQLHLAGCSNQDVAAKLGVSPTLMSQERSGILKRVVKLPGRHEYLSVLWAMATELETEAPEFQGLSSSDGQAAGTSESSLSLVHTASAERRRQVAIELNRIIALTNEVWEPEDIRSFRAYVYGVSGPKIVRAQLHMASQLRQLQPVAPKRSSSYGVLTTEQWDVIEHAAGYYEDEPAMDMNEMTAYIANRYYKAGTADVLFAAAFKKLITAEKLLSARQKARAQAESDLADV